MHKILMSLVFLGLGFVALTAQAASPSTATTTLPPIGGEMTTIDLSAKVTDIDPAKRVVTLKSPQGNEIKLNVSEAVKNLNEVKKGDDVVVKYYESIAWNLVSPQDKEKVAKKTVVEAQSTSPAGKKPAVKELKEVNLVATITAVDKSVPNVTLKGPDGNSVTFKVAEPKRLEKLKVGDQVDITYTQALAVSVEKAKK